MAGATESPPELAMRPGADRCLRSPAGVGGRVVQLFWEVGEFRAGGDKASGCRSGCLWQIVRAPPVEA